MELPTLVPIEYYGELVALVSPRRVHIISPRLRAAAVGDRDLMFVALMCACCSEVLAGNLPGPYTDALGETWARRALAVSAPYRHDLRVVVPAAAGSSPVAHPSRVPANAEFLSRSGPDGPPRRDSLAATTPGTEAAEAGDESPLRLRGDELDLYAEFHFEQCFHRRVLRAGPRRGHDRASRRRS